MPAWASSNASATTIARSQGSCTLHGSLTGWQPEPAAHSHRGRHACIPCALSMPGEGLLALLSGVQSHCAASSSVSAVTHMRTSALALQSTGFRCQRPFFDAKPLLVLQESAQGQSQVKCYSFAYPSTALLQHFIFNVATLFRPQDCNASFLPPWHAMTMPITTE